MNSKAHFLETKAPRWLLTANLVLAIGYFILLAFFIPRGNPYLFGLLIAGEVFHLWQIVGYVLTVWNTEKHPVASGRVADGVDIFITVAGEPLEIVRETAVAALAIRHPQTAVWILNDSYVAKKENWEEYEGLAKQLGIGCITRTVPGGAKAGNINNALRQTENPFVVIFDADHVPHPDFLEKTVGYFAEPSVGFVQSPQFYHNSGVNAVTGGAWEQQELFFGPIMKGKNAFGAAFMCGTNMVLRRTAVEAVGGMCETNIAEDFLTSVFVHERGWKSVYVAEVLAEGLAPEDFLSYYKQQFRWARGSLEVIFKYNPLFRRGMTWKQRFQYLASASYYLSGAVVVMNALLPLVFFFFKLAPVATSTMIIAAIFLPYILSALVVLQVSSNFTYTYRALSFSVGSCVLQLSALWAVLTGKKSTFAVTSKTQLEGNFLYLVIPQTLYVAAAVFGIGYAFARDGLTPAVITNAAWALLNVGLFLPFIWAAAPKGVTGALDRGLQRLTADV